MVEVFYILCPKNKKKKIKEKIGKLSTIEIKLSFNGSEIISSMTDY